MPLLSAATAVYAGSVPAQAVYLGATQVWSAAWTPAKLPQLAAWVDSAQIPGAVDGQRVQSMTESSPNKRSFTAPAGEGPFWQASLSGRPALYFSGSEYLITSGFDPGPTGITYVAVNRYTVATSYPMIFTWNQDVGHGYELRYPSAGQLQLVGDFMNGGPTWSSTYVESANVDYLNWAEFNAAGTSSRLLVNGADKGSGGMVSVMPNVGAELRLGRRTDGYWFIGMMREAMIFKGTLSTADRWQVEDYIQAKYGLVMTRSS